MWPRFRSLTNTRAAVLQGPWSRGLLGIFTREGQTARHCSWKATMNGLAAFMRDSAGNPSTRQYTTGKVSTSNGRSTPYPTTERTIYTHGRQWRKPADLCVFGKAWTDRLEPGKTLSGPIRRAIERNRRPASTVFGWMASRPTSQVICDLFK